MITAEEINRIAKKWQEKWREAKIFECDVDKSKKKFFVTVPYPYINGAPHLGHAYTFLRTDAYARFKRMQGYNVLFPQGFHATGEPILGVVERLRQGDRKQEETLKKFGVTDKDIENFKKDVKYLVFFWKERWIQDLNFMGLSIDWRRTFITTDITPQYSKFIEWQYLVLRDKGYITKGTHPVIWCPHCQSPTGDHDRLEGEGESPVEFILIKFKFEGEEIESDFKDAYIVCATLRPETIFGVVNIWVNPEAKYCLCKVDGEKWIISESCVEKLKDQLKEVKVLTKIEGKFLIGKFCKNMLTGKEVPILPAAFVDPENATGLVMSVPSHAPYDYIAVKEIIENEKELLKKINVSEDDLKPIVIIDTPDFEGKIPAETVVKELGIKSQEEKDKLERATKIVYKKEFHKGKLNEKCNEYVGMDVKEIKEKLSKDLIDKGIADRMWETSSKVVCRCNTRCHVKILKDQWFLRYSDEEWKNRAKKLVKSMRIIPEEARNQFLFTIDWLKDKACARKSGLGTKLPWDKEWIVETLSDSTIYMAYYTIARIINERKIKPELLMRDVFDYIFLNKGSLDEVSKKSGLDKEIIKEMKEEFEYFYPLDFRNSGKDLITNHLTFFLMHHVAIWDEREDKWPRCVSVNGFVKIEGEKMSKSKGNFLTARELCEKYGVDMVRINMVCSSEGIEDADWREENIKGYESKLEYFMYLINNLEKMEGETFGSEEKALASRIERIKKIVHDSYEEMRFRTAVNHALFESYRYLKNYEKRKGNIEEWNKSVIKKTLESIVLMLSPLIPHLAEEMWQSLGKKSFVSQEKWPETEENQINKEAEIEEEYLLEIIEDVKEIEKIKGTKIKKVKITPAEEERFEAFAILMSKGRAGFKEALEKGKINPKVCEKMLKEILKKGLDEKDTFLSRGWEIDVLKRNKEFLERELNAEVEIIEDLKMIDEEKRKKAMPFKPAIEVI